MKKLVVFFILSVAVIGCKKDKKTNVSYQTIQPLSYYPVYPGSFWRYLENNSDTILHETSETYLPHSYLMSQGYNSSGNWEKQYSDTVYVPFLNNKPIYGYEKIDWVQPPFGDYHKKWPIISEKIGFTYNREWTDERYGDFNEHLIVAEKIVNAENDSIIVVKGKWVYGPNISNVSVQTYVKDVGLYSHYVIDTVTNDTTYRLQLLNFYINK